MRQAQDIGRDGSVGELSVDVVIVPEDDEQNGKAADAVEGCYSLLVEGPPGRRFRRDRNRLLDRCVAWLSGGHLIE